MVMIENDYLMVIVSHTSNVSCMAKEKRNK